jgi:ADP-dependent NAD(P)H-hydrate dehydratase / NAD(P)H-hydrate epimerase
MKIFSAAQIRECDAITVSAQNISPADLMERAASQCVQWILKKFPKNTAFLILCGTGNNGGDGLAIARLLHNAGTAVKAFVLDSGKGFSADCRLNLRKLQSLAPDLAVIVAPENFISEPAPSIVIIDAIFGTGLSRPVDGWLATFISKINLLPNTVVAIDMPSGMAADFPIPGDAPIMMADYTLTFQFLKRIFLHPECEPHTGQIAILDIGLDGSYIKNTHTHFVTTELTHITKFYRKRQEFAHKGTFGNILLVGGSYGKIGAICLSSLAALRSGAGLVTALLPECGYVPLQTAIPEIMCLTSGLYNIEQIDSFDNRNAIGIGPGLGTSQPAIAAFISFIEKANRPLVLDADALNIIALHPELFVKIPKYSILTPHPKEFERLFGASTNSIAQTDMARIQAMKYEFYIVLKGHHTVVVTPEGECRYNTTGNSGMATAGSGDVLTGIITSLLGQGYPPGDAATLGVYLHGVAGDIAAAANSKEALIASDIINNLGKAFIQLNNDARNFN